MHFGNHSDNVFGSIIIIYNVLVMLLYHYIQCMRDNVEFLVLAAKERNQELNLRCCHANTCGFNTCGMIPLDK